MFVRVDLEFYLCLCVWTCSFIGVCACGLRVLSIVCVCGHGILSMVCVCGYRVVAGFWVFFSSVFVCVDIEVVFSSFYCQYVDSPLSIFSVCGHRDLFSYSSIHEYRIQNLYCPCVWT